MTLEAPTHGPCAPVQAGALTLTDLKEDYMEDWQRLSSMMLLDSFWKATIAWWRATRRQQLARVAPGAP